jgi:lactoylglutathione lyase
MAAKELRVVLTVDDHEQAVAFYRDLLGLPQLAAERANLSRCLMYQAGKPKWRAGSAMRRT